mmetsp:Transcript_30616/g.42234  ORF Transcript_30616/g.42234 Transcript_30616/m.42234 type:complete len:92 (+) Transcript_30616:597-872(+)
MTLSARYEAIIKSCSTTKALFFECSIKRFITFDAFNRCSLSRYAEGSSSKYTSAGVPRARTMATRCSSPPERFNTARSISSSIRNGRVTSV